MKRLIVFDLDGTLTASKSPLDSEMADLLGSLLDSVMVAVISGGAWDQYETQFLSQLADGSRLDRLFLLPTCGTQFFRHDGGRWTSLYSEDIGAGDRARIIAALNEALDQTGFRPETHWGELIEDRGSQITLSALGQQAPLAEKKVWDPDFVKRKQISGLLFPLIPGFSIRMGGATSIDVTREGIDKAYGIGKLQEVLGVAIADMVFVGDALFPGGNDEPAKLAGVLSIAVRDPHETKRVVEAITACLVPQPAEQPDNGAPRPWA
jgi:phosphomannomutase